MTVYQHLYFLCCLLIIDLFTLRILRKLLRDFLRSKKNKQKMNELYKSQPLQSRLLLDYIYPLLRHNQEAFLRYYKLHLAVLYSEVPQYLLILVLYFLLSNYAIFVVFIFGGIKIVIWLIVRSAFDANMVSVYRQN